MPVTAKISEVGKARYVIEVAGARLEFGDDAAVTTLRRTRGSAPMMALSPTARVFVVVAPLDLRGSFEALAGAVRRLGLGPVDGRLYLFLLG